MQFVVLGAGGIGSACAAFLARAGHAVRLVARGAHRDAIRTHGLTVTGLADFTVDVEAVDRASGPCDALVLATKTPDTAAALEAVADLRPRMAFSLQNGIAKDEQLEAAFGREAVLGATTMIGAARTAPGRVELTLDGVTVVGELDGGLSPRVEELAAAWSASGLPMRAVDDIVAHEWAKQALQAGAAPLAALTYLPTYLIYKTPPLAACLVRMAREVVSVAAALGIEPTSYDGYGFDVRRLASAPLEEAVAMVVAAGEALEARGKTDIIVSMSQDVRAGRRTEIEETVGHVVRIAEEVGVDVPVLRFAADAIRGIEVASGAHGGRDGRVGIPTASAA
jgi:2-dehydropantoate 2-reductase